MSFPQCLAIRRILRRASWLARFELLYIKMLSLTINIEFKALFAKAC